MHSLNLLIIVSYLVSLKHWTIQHIQHNASFEAPPPDTGGREAVWDSLIPSKFRQSTSATLSNMCIDGLGYVKHPDLAPEISMISVFHQLHCLVSNRANLDP